MMMTMGWFWSPALRQALPKLPASESGSSQLSPSVAIDVCGFVGQECRGTSLTLQGVEG